MKLILVALFLVCLQNGQVDSSQRDVYEKIFDGYRNDLRPVHDESTQMVVKVQPQIWSLLEVNPAQEYIKASIYLNQQWKDEFLTWDPSEFNGTTSITVPAWKIWKPDVTVLSTSLEPEYFSSSDQWSVFVNFDGTVYMSYPFVLTNYCKMEITDYPFDTQECIIRLSSWIYSNEELTLEHFWWRGKDASSAMNLNTAWDILPYVNDSFLFLDSADATTWELWYRQKIRRKPQYYVLVLIAPTFIITVLSLAGLYSPFNNSGDREEKVTLGLTTLLTLAVILTMVTGDMPRGSRLPVLGRFVLIEIILIVVSMAISVLIMFIHERATTRSWALPVWLNSSCLCSRQGAGKITHKQNIVSNQASCKNEELKVYVYPNSQSLTDQIVLQRTCLQSHDGRFIFSHNDHLLFGPTLILNYFVCNYSIGHRLSVFNVF